MNNLVQYCNCAFYCEYDSSTLLASVQHRIDASTSILNHEFQFIFHTMLNTDPCSYWNEAVYSQTLGLLEVLHQNYSTQLSVDETVLNYFLMGYSAYRQISETIVDLKNFNLATEMKTRLYRLPTYTSILESCLSNFLRVIAILTGKCIGKDYSLQNTLGQLVTVASSNGFTQIVQNIDVNIRNAINHGKVIFKKDPADQICFYYSENRIQKCNEMPIYKFDQLIDSTYDTASAVLLAIAVFINKHISLLQVDESKTEFVPFALLSMRLSLPGIECQSISDTGSLFQLNTEISIENTDPGYIRKIAFLIAPIVFEKYNCYDQYLFSFCNPRMPSGWIRFKKQDLVDLITETKQPTEVLAEIIERKEYLIFPTSSDDIDLNEVKYFCFPNYHSNTFKINNVADASTADRKRLRANLYLGTIDDRTLIIDTIKEAIEWLLSLRNPPSPILTQKYGDMPADALYINVYRSDGRKSKELLTTNENFVCFVDYNSNGITTLVNGGLPPTIWNSLSHEKVDNMHIAWREGKHITRRIIKIGRNDPCPCGSGSKYKRCCGRNQG